MNVVVYTAITGGRDLLRSDQVVEGADWVAFLEWPELVRPWQPARACNLFTDPNRNAKIHKVLPQQYFPEADYSLWLDANLALAVPVAELIDRFLGDTDIAMFGHPERSCIYQEGIASLEQVRYPPYELFAQLGKYWRSGWVPGSGLVECGVILRRHTAAVERFNNVWWSEICRHTTQDQLSVLVAARTASLEIERIPGSIRHGNDFVRYGPHVGPSGPNPSGPIADLTGSVEDDEGEQVRVRLTVARTVTGKVHAQQVQVDWCGQGDLTVFARWLATRLSDEPLENMAKLRPTDLWAELQETAPWASGTMAWAGPLLTNWVWQSDDTRVPRLIELSIVALQQALFQL